MKVTHYVISVYSFMTTYLQVWGETVVDVQPYLLFMEGWQMPRVRAWVKKHRGRIRKQRPPRRMK